MSDQRIHSEVPFEGHRQPTQAPANGAMHPQGRKPCCYRLLYNQAKGFYRLQSIGDDERDIDPMPAYTVLEEYSSRAELKTTLRHWPHLFCFITYEASPRDVVVTPCEELPEDWLDDDRYTPFVLFNDEAEARRYAKERREALTSRRTAA